VLPEETGLVAALTGSRGTAARAQTTATDAILALFGPYSAPYGYYRTRYPGQPAVRTLVLALTDTLYRGFYETFRELAMTHGIYLAASFNAAPARRVEEATEPALVALLRDPDEPSRTYAYEAVSPFPHNTTLVFAPDGEVLVPDSLKESAAATLEKNVPWVANVDASITGNLFDDVTFDAQSAVLRRKQKTSPGPLGPNNAWIGQNPDTGFRTLAPWIAPDPGI